MQVLLARWCPIHAGSVRSESVRTNVFNLHVSNLDSAVIDKSATAMAASVDSACVLLPMNLTVVFLGRDLLIPC